MIASEPALPLYFLGSNIVCSMNASTKSIIEIINTVVFTFQLEVFHFELT